jgi:hypothetical protein
MRRSTIILGIVALCLPSCGWDGHFTVLGYTTRPNYDPCIRTVYVPIFKNLTFRRGLEFDLTKAVVREIEAKTPYKVVSNCDEADTELTGTIVNYRKSIINANQLNEVREAETMLGVEIVWRDRRTGDVLSQPRKGDEPPPPLAPGEPLPPAKPLLVQSVGGFIPELGESITTGYKENVDRLAVQIVSMMERPW